MFDNYLTLGDKDVAPAAVWIGRFTLAPAAGGPPVLTGSVRAVTSYSAPVSETSSAFASEIARQDAQDRVARALADKIVLRLAVAAGRLEAAPVAPVPDR